MKEKRFDEIVLKVDPEHSHRQDGIWVYQHARCCRRDWELFNPNRHVHLSAFRPQAIANGIQGNPLNAWIRTLSNDVLRRTSCSVLTIKRLKPETHFRVTARRSN